MTACAQSRKRNDKLSETAGQAATLLDASVDDTPGNAVNRLMSEAVERLRGGDLGAAKGLFEQVLEIAPAHPHATHFLGVIAHQSGEHERAVELIHHALVQIPNDAGAHSNLGAALLALGRTKAAEESFRRAVELNPALAEVHSNLAAVLNDLGRMDEAIAAYRDAQQAAPNVPKFVKRLADLYLEHEKYADAAEWFRRYLALNAADAEVHNNLAHSLERCNRPEEAERHYHRAAELCPESLEVNNNLATMLKSAGRHEEAEVYFQRALAIAPRNWMQMANLANTYLNRGEVDHALPIYERLIADHPDNARLHNDYAIALTMDGRLDEAEALLERAVTLKPDYAEAWNNLAGTRLSLGKRKEAIDNYKQAIAHRPRFLEPHINLCLALSYENRTDEAYMFAQATVHLESFRPRHFTNPHKVFRGVCDFDAIEGLGDLWHATEQMKVADYSSNFLEMLVLAETEPQIERLSALHRSWYREVVRRAIREPLPPIEGERRSGKLRIGIMSSDLRNHSVAKFVLPVLEHYDRSRFEIYCYNPVEESEDAVQRKVKTLVKEFRTLNNTTDREFAEAIRTDGIDILFELNGFTRDTRLKVLSYKPAPVQIYWLGYPFTTGIDEIDYILLDQHLKPVKDEWLVEKPLLMPRSWVCFGSFSSEPISEKLPLERHGAITFGSLNNPYKLTRSIVALWSRVMHQVPNSRFLYVRPECRSFMLVSNLTKEFERNGISADRLYFLNNRRFNLSHLSYYDEIDITLDTWPLTGGTTTCDTLWMGTPVVTKYGPNMHQRLSYSMLMNLGLDQLCVQTDDDYVRVASELAKDPEALRFLRRELRRSVQESALGDAEAYARNFCDLMEQVAVRHGLR